MSGTITGELRRRSLEVGGILGDDGTGRLTTRTYYVDAVDFDRCCDAIDAVHANLEAENESLRRELDRVLGEREDRDGWVEPPKDADGEYVYVGDVMEWRDSDHDTFEVIGIGDDVLFYFDPDADDEVVEWTSPMNKRHHRPDSWASIIRDAYDAGVLGKTFDMSAAVARCKALAGDAS